jgi:hypothetical protein
MRLESKSRNAGITTHSTGARIEWLSSSFCRIKLNAIRRARLILALGGYNLHWTKVFRRSVLICDLLERSENADTVKAQASVMEVHARASNAPVRLAMMNMA